MTSNEKPIDNSTKPPTDWRERLSQLMRQLVDDALEPAQQRELVSILESSDDAKRYYLNYLQLHADLGSEWGSEWGGEDLPLRVDHDVITESPTVNRASDASDSRATLRALGWLILGMAASSLFFVVMLRPELRPWWAPQTGAVAVKLETRDDVPKQPPNEVAVDQDASRQVANEIRTASPKNGWTDVAVIVRNEGVDDQSLQVGMRLAPGVLRFETGTLQLQFMSGATMVLEGPAELKIESAKVATLVAGTVKTRVNDRAKGFILNTADAAVVDIGTEFGLRFDDSGQPEVEVMEGEVEFSLLGADGSTLTSRRVQQSEIVAVDHHDSGPARLADKAKRNAGGPLLSLPIVAPPATNDQYSALIREHRPLVYWRFETETDGIVPNEMGEKWSAKITQSPGDETTVTSEPTITVKQGRLNLQRGDAARCVISDEPIQGLDASDFAIEFWMNPDDLEHSHCVGLTPFLMTEPMAYLSVVEIVTDTFLIHQPGSLRVLYRNPPGRRHEYGKNVFSPGMVTPGQWHHVTMVNSEDALSLYLNGKLVRSLDSEMGNEPTSPEGFRIILGQLTKDLAMRQFAGAIDEFALYDRALEPSEILEHYQVGTNIR